MKRQPLTREMIRMELLDGARRAAKATAAMMAGVTVSALLLYLFFALIAVSVGEGWITLLIPTPLFLLFFVLAIWMTVSRFRELKLIDEDRFVVREDEVVEKGTRYVYYYRRHREQMYLVFYDTPDVVVGNTDFTLADRGDRYYLVFADRRHKRPERIYRAEAYEWKGSPLPDEGSGSDDE